MKAATLDPRAYDAQRYRITQVGARPTPRLSSDGSRFISYPFGDHLYAKLLPGIAKEFDREELLGLLAESDDDWFRKQLGSMFTKESLSVEAWIDERWVAVSLARKEEAQGQRQKGKPGRRRLEHDTAARELYEKGEKLRLQHPGITRGQIAARLTLSPSTYKRYVSRFSPK